MFYKARWYDPALGRFAQADTIIPEQTQGVQAWDRYAYTNNNPLKYNDPSGHCIGLGDCFWKILNTGLFLLNRVSDNGGLTDNDFRDAANYAVPAVASGSKESVSVYGSMVATWAGSISLVTTADGQAQVFNERTTVKNKVPEAAGLPGVGLSVTHGEVHGLTEDGLTYDPSLYAGGATQGNVSIPAFCGGACGPYGEGYLSDDRQVWGLDAGLEFGIGPTILATAHMEAEEAQKVLWVIPVDFLNKKLSGKELLGCRLLSMCGAR